jgi:hypothetical protein
VQRDKQFFVEVVVPTVDEYLSDPTDLRRGFLAAIVLYHMSDYWEKETAGRDVEDLRRLYPDFKLINEIATAAKHRSRDRGIPMITRSDQIKSTPHPGLFQANFGAGMFAEASEVIVTLDDNTHVHLKPAIETVLSMWRSYYPS